MKLLAVLLLAGFGANASDIPIKNFLQIPYALESATGISAKTPDILSYYSNQKGKFPLRGELNEITVPEVLSQMSYASYFCEKMIVSDINLPAAQRWVHKSFDFTKKPSDWSDAQTMSVFTDYAEIFWQRSLDSEEIDILKTEVRAMRANFPNEAASNKGLLTSVCSAMAGSFAFILL
jgi:hypothetical protein